MMLQLSTETMKNTIQLGINVTDKITGFSGTVTGMVKYITGCDQALITPRVTDNTKYPEANWIDVNRLIVNEDVEMIIVETSKDVGAMESPPKY